MNSLLDFSGLPRFADFEITAVTPAIDQLIGANRALVETLAGHDVPATWDDFVSPLYDANEKLNRVWSQVSHLNAVMNSNDLREVYNANLPKITQYYTELGQHTGLFRKFSGLKDTPAFNALNSARRKIVENELRDFRLGGVELGDAEKARFAEIRERLAELSSRFSDNVLDATNDYRCHITDPARLAGLPADVREAAAELARTQALPGWVFTLHAPAYVPVMQYAEDRSLRELLYRAYATRASEFGKPEWDNTALISEIVGLRRELSRLLGFASYAEYSLATKMATSPKQVLEFLNELALRARPFAVRDVGELETFAREALQLSELRAWDIAFVAEKLRIARYAFSEQEVRQYFPQKSVLAGLFHLVEKLYGVKVEPARAATWHPDVHFFALSERSGRALGYFYMDLYARPQKRGGAWMDDAITRRRTIHGIQVPVAYLTCNFSAPVGEAPALFTHEEVITLFHEFGHGLHHLLTRIDELGVSGINGVEWDAVELPSQFMENFCWEYAVIATMTCHVKTGEPLPKSLFDKMLAARNFQSGLQTLRQIEFALFDMQLHDKDMNPNECSAIALLETIRNRIAVMPTPAFNRFPQSFSHIFAGGYAAGYYSYQWAEVLSADAYEMFTENGVFDAVTGARFWNEILAVGGSRPALESFVAFRGRPPKLDALLRQNGMLESVSA